MKKAFTILSFILSTSLLVAQSQYDYYDDGAVAGGADRAFNGLVIEVLIVIGAFAFILLGGVFYKIYYGLNPGAKPENKAQIAKDEKYKIEKQLISKTIPVAIDLGLSVKWCNINFGVTKKPNSVGGYYYWGETHYYNPEKYDLKTSSFRDIGDISGNIQYDIVTKTWDSEWRIPTKCELQELIEKCKWTKTVRGYNVKGPNGNTIFIPFTGYFSYKCSPFEWIRQDEGNYWSSTPKQELQETINQSAYSLSFGGRYIEPIIHERVGHDAIMIRPVKS